MIKIFKVLKYLIITALSAFFVIYASLFLLLSIPSVQQKVRDIGVKELSQILNTRVSIGKVSISPFNKIALQDLYLQDQQGDTLLYANKLAAGIELLPLFKKKIEITSVQFFGFNIKISKENPDATPNYQFIIDAFKPKENQKKKQPFEVQINTILIRRGQVSYDIKSEPFKEAGQFDKNHIRVKNLLSTLSLKSIQKDSINVFLKRMSLDERSGFSLNRLTLKVIGTPKMVSVTNFKLQLPHTQLSSVNFTADLSQTDSLKHFFDTAELKCQINHGKIGLQDIAPFIPALRHFTTPIDLSLQIRGSVNHFVVNNLHVNYGNGLIDIKTQGNLDEITHLKNTYLFGQIKNLTATSAGIQSIIKDFSPAAKPLPLLERLGDVHFKGDISGFLTNLVAYGEISSAVGKIHTDIMISRDEQKSFLAYKGSLETNDFHLGALLDNSSLENISLKLNLDGYHKKNNHPVGKLDGTIRNIDYKGYSYENIQLNGSYNGSKYDGMIDINDPNGRLYMQGIIDLLNKRPVFRFVAVGDNIHLGELNLVKKYKDSNLSFNILANFEGNSLDNADGNLLIDSLYFYNNGKHFLLDKLNIEAQNQQKPQSIKISSDILNGEMIGDYSFKTIKTSFMNMLSSALPSFISKNEQQILNDFSYSFTISNTKTLSEVFDLPVFLSEDAAIDGFLSDADGRFRVEATLPDFTIKKAHFESGSIMAEKINKNVVLSVRTNSVNKKNQYMILSLKSSALDDNLDTKLNWSNIGKSTFCGELSFSSLFQNGEKEAPFSVKTEVNSSNLVFNDTIWNVAPAEILIDSGKIQINDFEIRHESQFLRIDGLASTNPSDEIILQLKDLNLDYIFQTLNINNVVFGGRATGDFLISNILKAPILSTKQFDVDNFSYNNAILGNLHLFSRWENESQGILLQGSIAQKNYPDTHINGYIYPTKDSLYLSFDAQHINLELLRPFIGNVLTNVSGHATGKIDFYGNFKALTVAGDAYADKFTFGIDYLNTVYSLSDSVHLTPTTISFDNITVHDKYGNTAKARGLLRHQNFKDLVYEIGISNANNFQVFNLTEQQNPLYYGTVFGNGTATISGDLTKTNIDVNMRTDAHSKFTFVLSNSQTANDYQFITFKNKAQKQREQEIKDSLATANNRGIQNISKPVSNVLNLNLQIDATPDATMQLIMDPTSGDVIKANGNGSIRLEYNSVSDMKIYGTYTLEKGSYNFSLQDLINRDFSIKSGSSITFKGDPMAADLNIDAIYSLNANLQDLDESFADDKELSRTIVPVQTVLKITGNLQRPDLNFDIAFPTLSQDVDRRVKSIISTEDMMNRQIIYLLALNRFYTPDYMNLGQRGNELASVASSTLSSQLSNMLGQISENWNIGTNIRSDKGDFSDVEVELALSSQLLNNRLIFNGNFGYRDNAVNNNTFIGDFDLEYLLSKNGNLRLKAYNHYNDKNYYIKSALTTQGVGIVFKRDFNRFEELFDRIEKLFRKKPKQPNKTSLPMLSIPRDSIK